MKFQIPKPHAPPGLSMRADELRSLIRSRSIQSLSAKSGCTVFSDGKNEAMLSFQYFSRLVTAPYPQLNFVDQNGLELSEFDQLLLLYYLSTADGTALSGKYVTFGDLPGGRMYAAAFQGYSGDQVVKTFGDKLAELQIACEKSGGTRLSVGDAAYTFYILPKISIQVVYWLGDEDFPSSCKVLFDAFVTHYVPIDACAMIGSMITRRINKNSPALRNEK